MSSGESYVFEFVSAQALISAFFSLGLNPWQNKVFGTGYGSDLVGTTLVFSNLASTLVKPGYIAVAQYLVVRDV